MKQIQKLLISIFLISMLTSALVLTNAKENANTTTNQPVLQPIKVGEKTIFPIENTTQVVPAISSRSDTSIITIPYSATYTMYDPNYYRIHDAATIGFTEITNYTFYLPKASYVYMIVTGEIVNFKGSINLDAKMDNRESEQAGGSYFLGACNYCWTSFTQARGYYLSAGNHIVRLKGQEWWGDDRLTSVGGISITIIANEKGNLQIK